MKEIGELRHWVTLEGPGVPVPDGDGGYTHVWGALTPSQVKAEVKPATARDLERVTSGTVMSTASHIVTMRFHPQVDTKTRITFKGRTLSVTGVQNPDERDKWLVLTAEEVVA